MAEEFVEVRRSNRLVLLVGAVVALALPAIAGAQVTPFSFADDEVRMEFPLESATSGGGSVPTPLIRVFDLRSFIVLDAPEPGDEFNPFNEGATLTISQIVDRIPMTLFSLPMPPGSGWRSEARRIRFDGDVASVVDGVVTSVALSVDFLLKSGAETFADAGKGTVIEFNFEGDAATMPPLDCNEDGVAMTTVNLQIGPNPVESDATTVPAQCD